MGTPIMPFRMKGQTICIHHKGRQLEFYCRKCQELLCPKCLSTLHNSHPICELSEVTPQKKQDINNFIDRTEKNDLVQVRKYIASTDKLLKNNDSAFEKLSCQVKIQMDKLKQDLDKLTAETLSLYQEMKDDNTKLIQIYKHDLEMYDKQLKQQIQECKTALQDGSHLQIYDVSCEMHSSTSLPVKPVLHTASFTPNKTPQGHLGIALGRVITSGQDKPLIDQERSVSTSDDQGQCSKQQKSEDKEKKAATRYELLSETKVVGEFFWSEGNINLLYPTTDDQAWTSDYSDTLTLIDWKGNILQQVKHKDEITDISLSPTTNRLWVCDRHNNIMELISGRLTHRFRTTAISRCLCVTASNHVFVGITKHICKFNRKGDMVLTTGIVKPSACAPLKITECSVTHNLAVVGVSDNLDGGDGNKHVIVMDTDFQELFVYSGDIPRTYKQTTQTECKPFDPSGVVFDSVGNLIIGDNYNCRILLLGGGGEFLRIIHTDTAYICAVGVDRKDEVWAVISDYVSCCILIKQLQYSSM